MEISVREQITTDLKKALKDIANVELFQIYTFDESYLPTIIITDESDSVESSSFENIKHVLSIKLLLITEYKNANNLIKQTLEILKNFKSNFVKVEPSEINKDGLEIANKTYTQTTISLDFLYFTNLWEF